MWWFNRQRNGYRMACKPPVYRQQTPPPRFPGLARIPRSLAGRERTRGRVAAAAGWSWSLGALLADRPASAGHSRRNAVCRVGVKLGAAPDAPHWGKVLVRTPSDRISGARVRAASKFTCLSREHPACPAETTSVGGDAHGSAQPGLRWPASSGGGGRRGRKNLQAIAWPAHSSDSGLACSQPDSAAKAASTTRQRAARDRTGGRHPHPGKDPL